MEWKILDFFRPCQPCLFLSRQPQAFEAWKRNQDNEVGGFVRKCETTRHRKMRLKTFSDMKN